jgi:putative sugar O-methyltransferase
MKNTEKNLRDSIKEMMNISFKQDKIYQPGNYWKYYEPKIYKQIKNNKLSKFRAWEGGSGSGNISSFGGGDEFLHRRFNRNFHPFDDAFSFIDNFFLIKKYNGLINKLIKIIPAFKFFLIRAAEAKEYYWSMYKDFIKQKYFLIKKIDPDLTKISDSVFGLNEKKLVYVEDKIYTNSFLEQLLHIHEIKRNTNFKSINSVLELGAGIGLLASAFLKLKKNLKYLIIDIPPTLFFSEYYLKNIGYKVFGYNESAKSKHLDIEEIFQNYEVICLPSWKLEELSQFKFDLFVNIASFQEMEKEQTLNYLSVLKKNFGKYIYSENLIKGHKKTNKENSFGVLNPTIFEDIDKILSDKFKIINKEATHDAIYKILYEKK